MNIVNRLPTRRWRVSPTSATPCRHSHRPPRGTPETRKQNILKNARTHAHKWHVVKTPHVWRTFVQEGHNGVGCLHGNGQVVPFGFIVIFHCFFAVLSHNGAVCDVLAFWKRIQGSPTFVEVFQKLRYGDVIRGLFGTEPFEACLLVELVLE